MQRFVFFRQSGKSPKWQRSLLSAVKGLKEKRLFPMKKLETEK